MHNEMIVWVKLWAMLWYWRSFAFAGQKMHVCERWCTLLGRGPGYR